MARKKSVRKLSKRSKPQRKASRAATSLGITQSTTIRMRALGIAASASTDANTPKTVIYIHGINNKPPASILKCQWDMALFRTRLGDRSRMAYWVNREYYPTPLDETCAAPDTISVDDDQISTHAVMALARGERGDEERAIELEIQALADSPARQAFLRRLAGKMVAETASRSRSMRTSAQFRTKLLPVPEFLRRIIAEKITRAFLRDVNDFLFVEERRKMMEQSLIDRIESGGGPFVVIAHSQGSMVAYNVLRRLERARCQVPLFVTIGSPLGIQEVQDGLRQLIGTGAGKLPFPPCVDRWINVADRLDPVAIDNKLNGEFGGKIDDETVMNRDSPRHPHSGTGYLSTDVVRSAVRQIVGPEFQQAITRFALAKDLVGDMEDASSEERHSALIQLTDVGSKKDIWPVELDSVRKTVTSRIHALLKEQDEDPKLAEIENLRHFIAAKLTRLELEALRSDFDALKISGIWRNAKKRALIANSTHTVQAKPANLGYGADGRKICWAVLDTGIRGDHPHFKQHNNIIEQWDCTQPGAPILHKRGSKGSNQLDGDGHGTHVAGIIAGEYEVRGEHYTGMAPRCSLIGFKVLDDNGEGDDGWIIKGLDKVAQINEAAGTPVIHGVNLSLGGAFDPEVFGCGHTPLCQELRRLWRQGVLVCLAAGNEGYAVLQGEEGDVPTNLDLSIGDPANLDEAIAVGSVHKTNPHTYGISYFSSRGPTADGRRKPDVVAPGERILSASHDFWRRQKLYVELSGTSMACPHVSGVLAAFLSLRREFIGYPDRVKSLLLGGCVDLGRDPYMQGAGLPNLIKMLALN
jgi:subtilisin family serine protease